MSQPGAPPPSSGSDPAHAAHTGGPPELLERVMQDLQDVHLARAASSSESTTWSGRTAASSTNLNDYGTTGLATRSPSGGRSKRSTPQVTSGAVEQAPPVVRGAAGFDQQTVVHGTPPTPEEITAMVSGQVGEAIGGQKGAALARTLTSSTAPGADGNAVTRGAKSLGRGIKRIVGGGDKSTSQAKKPGGQ